MSEAKHTAGPWRARRNDPNGDRFILYTGTDSGQAFSHFQGWSSDGLTTEEEDEANARLIAAAPDLLRVVEAVFLWNLSKNIGKGKRRPSPLYPHIVEAARAALQKAGV